MAMSKHVVTVIQARTGSSRLPNKVLRPLLEKPLLVRIFERVRAAKLSGTVVVATTNMIEDRPIAWVCKSESIPLFRGHPTDLLDRHYRAGKQFDADIVVKIPSDCPLIDPDVIDRVIGTYLENLDTYDFVSNLHPATYPDGNDVEVMPMSALETAWQEATRDFEREHTTPYFWENPDRFRIKNLTWETGLNYAMSHRWTIDYEEDYQFIRAVYEALYPQNGLFSLDDIVQLLVDRPDIAAINQKYAGVNWYRHHIDELNTISSQETRMEMANS